MPQLATPINAQLGLNPFQPINPAIYFDRTPIPVPIPDTSAASAAAAKSQIYGSLADTLKSLPDTITAAYQQGKKMATSDLIRSKLNAGLQSGNPSDLMGFKVDTSGDASFTPQTSLQLLDYKNKQMENKLLQDKIDGTSDPVSKEYQLENDQWFKDPNVISPRVGVTGSTAPVGGTVDASVFGLVPDGKGGLTSHDPNDISDAGVKGFSATKGAWGANIKDPALQAVAVSPDDLSAAGVNLKSPSVDSRGLLSSHVARVTLPDGSTRDFPIADKLGTPGRIDLTGPAYQALGGPMDQRNGGLIKGVRYSIVPKDATASADTASVAPGSDLASFPIGDLQQPDSILSDLSRITAVGGETAGGTGSPAALSTDPVPTVAKMGIDGSLSLVPDAGATQSINPPLPAVTFASSAVPQIAQRVETPSVGRDPSTGGIIRPNSPTTLREVLPHGGARGGIVNISKIKIGTPDYYLMQKGINPDLMTEDQKQVALQRLRDPITPEMRNRLAEKGLPTVDEGGDAVSQSEAAKILLSHNQDAGELNETQIRHVDHLRDRFENLPLYKVSSDVSDGYNNLKDALNLNSGIGDKMLIEEGQRVLNPKSGVRPTTIKMFGGSSGLLERIDPNYILTHFEKGRFLTDEQRKEYSDIVTKAFKRRTQEMDALANSHVAMAQRAGIPKDAASAYFDNPYAVADDRPEVVKPSVAPSTIVTVNSQADYDALPSGARYRDSNGKLAVKK